LEDLFAPLDFSCILGYPHKVHINTCATNIPKFDGNPWMDSRYVASFMNYMVDSNIVHDDILMKMLHIQHKEKFHGIGIVI